MSSDLHAALAAGSTEAPSFPLCPGSSRKAPGRPWASDPTVIALLCRLAQSSDLVPRGFWLLSHLTSVTRGRISHHACTSKGRVQPRHQHQRRSEQLLRGCCEVYLYVTPGVSETRESNSQQMRGWNKTAARPVPQQMSCGSRPADRLQHLPWQPGSRGRGDVHGTPSPQHAGWRAMFPTGQASGHLDQTTLTQEASSWGGSGAVARPGVCINTQISYF